MCVYSLGIVALESVVLVSGSGTVAAEDDRVVDESVTLGLAMSVQQDSSQADASVLRFAAAHCFTLSCA